MAKQNFLKGGYVGKLGQTVGQRWKDKRVIRVLTKPANPRTPAQQAMRKDFATANKLAQQAMLVNGHQGIWDTTKAPEYSLRVGQAMRMLREGKSEQEALPLYPVAPEQKANVKIVKAEYTGNDSIEITLTGFKNLPIAKLKGISIYPSPDGLSAYEQYDEDIDFDAATGTFEIVLAEPYAFYPGDVVPMGLELTAYDASDNEIPTAKIDWNYYAQGRIALFPKENFKEELDLTGTVTEIQQGNAYEFALTSVTPEEAAITLVFQGGLYEAGTPDANELVSFALSANPPTYPATVELAAAVDTANEELTGYFWVVYEKANKVWCRAGEKTITL